jgi:hypothetical protein
MSPSPLRIVGLAIGAALLVLAYWRRDRLRNVDVLAVGVAGVALLVVSGTNLADAVLAFFSFHRGDGGRILGLAVFAIAVLFVLLLRALWASGRTSREVSALLEGLACERLKTEGALARFADRIGVVIPAYDEQDGIRDVIRAVPERVCGVETAVLVVDDGSRDATSEAAAAEGATVARHVINRGGGAALRTGYRLMAEAGARVVVTLDADGQHVPAEMECLVGPVLSGRVDVAHGSRVLGQADPSGFARELGITFFNRLVSAITRTKVSDCSNGYRAVRTGVLGTLVLRQEQFHTSEFLIEAIKRGIPACEIPVTVLRRTHGRSKKPAVMRYGLGFANAIVRTWLR